MYKQAFPFSLINPYAGYIDAEFLDFDELNDYAFDEGDEE